MTAHEGGGVKVLKVNARYLEGGEVLLERDSIAPLNFGEILNFVMITSSPSQTVRRVFRSQRWHNYQMLGT